VCWSAPADLTMGAVVVAIGVGGMALARHRRDLPLAALPVLLGSHQLIESRIWAESPGPGADIRGPAVVVWTIIAFAVLPGLVPLALLRAERQRRRLQWACAVVGLAVAGVMGYAIAQGVNAVDHTHVMDYGAGIPLLPLVLVGYIVATIVPFLLSPEPTLRELGYLLTVGATIAGLLDVLAFASVWCAFAALFSLLVIRRTVHASHNLAPGLV
jgi:hypothetical protein